MRIAGFSESSSFRTQLVANGYSVGCTSLTHYIITIDEFTLEDSTRSVGSRKDKHGTILRPRICKAFCWNSDPGSCGKLFCALVYELSVSVVESEMNEVGVVWIVGFYLDCVSHSKL